MGKVNKILLFLLLLAVSVLSQSERENCSISYPAHIPLNSPFDISIITSKVFKSADVLEIYIIPGSGIEPKSAEFRSNSFRKKLTITEIDLNDVSEKSFRIIVDLADSSLTQGVIFQVILSLKPDNVTASDFQFAGVFKRKNKTLGHLKNTDEFLIQKTIEPFFTRINLNFYKPQKYAGRSLQLNTGSFLEIKIPEFNSKYLSGDFWIRINNADMNIFSIISEHQSTKILELNYNSFCMLHLALPDAQLKYSEPKYLSKRLWNHISIVFEKPNNEIKLFCNDYQIGAASLTDGTSFDDLIIKFQNDSENKSYNLDQFRLIKTNDDIFTAPESQFNEHLMHENSEVIFSLKFDSSEELSALLQEKVIEFGGIQLVRSDAPIFTPAPELNISIYKNSYELSWQAAENKMAVSFVLEKSSGNNQFHELIRLQPVGDNEKTYSYADAIDQSDGIVFYRIKQINKGGDVVYSSSVKVGQGTVVEPILIAQNYPNPFNPKTSIVIDLIESSEVEITIYSLEGREISTIHQGVLEKGKHKFTFDGTELPSGIYLYKVSTPVYTQTRKMILAK